MTIASMFIGGAADLIGRDPRGIAEDYAQTDQASLDLLIAEYRAMETMIQIRAINLPPTRARNIAVELIPALATACSTMRAVDLLLEVTRDWIALMGDIRAHARAVASLREMGEDVEEARIVVPIAFNANAIFDVHDANALSVTLDVHRRPPVVVGMHYIDQDDGNRISTPTPELIA